jgi:hypothetical protein
VISFGNAATLVVAPHAVMKIGVIFIIFVGFVAQLSRERHSGADRSTSDLPANQQSTYLLPHCRGLAYM